MKDQEETPSGTRYPSTRWRARVDHETNNIGELVSLNVLKRQTLMTWFLRYASDDPEPPVVTKNLPTRLLPECLAAGR